MIFSGFFEKYWDKEVVWGPHQWATSPRDAGTPLAAPPRLVGPTGTPSTHSCSHLVLLPPEKNRFAAQTRVLAHLAVIFDLLAQSTILRTVLGKLLLGK